MKRETYTLYLCSRHPETPLYAKLFALLIIGYALSPIDLIPDFVPVLGYLDDLILIPAGIVLLIKMMPEQVLQECRQEALAGPPVKRLKSWVAASVIISIWLLALYTIFRFLVPFFPKSLH